MEGSAVNDYHIETKVAISLEEKGQALAAQKAQEMAIEAWSLSHGLHAIDSKHNIGSMANEIYALWLETLGATMVGLTPAPIQTTRLHDDAMDLAMLVGHYIEKWKEAP